MSTSVAVVYHSGYGHTEVIAQAVAEGARSVEGVDVAVAKGDCIGVIGKNGKGKVGKGGAEGNNGKGRVGRGGPRGKNGQGGPQGKNGKGRAGRGGQGVKPGQGERGDAGRPVRDV